MIGLICLKELMSAKPKSDADVSFAVINTFLGVHFRFQLVAMI